ncbi:MAG: hypothetical protein MUO58_19570 [Anaerolineales bacterium]|nr:hypothetical protein [Anaerolineales bacterium]
MRTNRIVALIATISGLALVTMTQAAAQQRPTEERLEGPVVRRVLAHNDTDPDDFIEMSPSLDGQRVAYVSMVDGSVRVRDLGTGDVRQLVGGLPAVWHSLPKWSPDGNRLAVATRDQATGATSIELIDVVTCAVEVVPGTLAERQRVVPMEWSRDGKSLLCVRGDRLVLIALGQGTLAVVADSVREYGGALSPDGRFAAYATRLGEVSRVFISPVAGGAPLLINALGASGGNPMWSPTGDAIAYESKDGIWVVPVRDGAATGAPRHVLVTGGISLRGWTKRGLYFTAWGETRQVPYQIRMNPATGASVGDEPETLPGGYPDEWVGKFAWSPDMQRVAFSHWHPAAVSVCPVSRGKMERFDIGKEVYAELPSWSADGHEVLVHVITPQVLGKDTICAVDPGTGRVRDLEPRIPNGFYASYSADGRTVAFARQAPSAITSWKIGEVVVAATGASDGLVVATGDDVGGPIINNPGPRLSPRGKKVVYVRHDRWSEPPGPATLWVVGSNGRGTRQVTTAARIRSMVWDPSGRFVAYMASDSAADGSAAALHVVEVETGADRRIPLLSVFPVEVEVSDWSRDGNLLGIVAKTQSRSNEYWVVQGLVEGGW